MLAEFYHENLKFLPSNVSVGREKQMGHRRASRNKKVVFIVAAGGKNDVIKKEKEIINQPIVQLNKS